VRYLEQDFWVHIVFHTIDLLAKTRTKEDMEEIIKNEDNAEFCKREEMKYDAFIITDARFENELQPKPYVFAYDVFNIKIDGHHTKSRISDEQLEHESEKMAQYKPNREYMITIHNDRTLQDLKEACNEVADVLIDQREKRFNKFLEDVQELHDRMETEEQVK
jgi:hypothetical protein